MIRAGDSADRECEQIKDEPHLREVAHGECERGIHSHFRSEALAEVLVHAHRYDLTKEWNNHNSYACNDEHKHDAGNEQRPIAGIGCTWIRDEGDAGDDGRQQRHANRPAGD
jgi:hypothetical protein